MTAGSGLPASWSAQLSHALHDVGDAHEGTDDALKLALRYGRDHDLGAAKILPLVVEPFDALGPRERPAESGRNP